MQNLYAMRLCDVPDPERDWTLLEGLTEAQKEKIRRCRTEKGRKESFASAVLITYVLERFGHTPQEIRVSETGKPEVDGIYFNMSHSREWIVCAVGAKPIGCDIEQMGRFRERVAKKICTKKEWTHLMNCSAEERERAFYRLWTMKESYVKMTGEGIRFPLDEMECTMEQAADTEVYRNGKKEACYLTEFEWEGARLTICMKGGKSSNPCQVAVVGFSEIFRKNARQKKDNPLAITR